MCGLGASFRTIPCECCHRSSQTSYNNGQRNTQKKGTSPRTKERHTKPDGQDTSGVAWGVARRNPCSSASPRRMQQKITRAKPCSRKQIKKEMEQAGKLKTRSKIKRTETQRTRNRETRHARKKEIQNKEWKKEKPKERNSTQKEEKTGQQRAKMI